MQTQTCKHSKLKLFKIPQTNKSSRTTSTKKRINKKCSVGVIFTTGLIIWLGIQCNILKLWQNQNNNAGQYNPTFGKDTFLENLNDDHVTDTISHNITYTENGIAIKEQLSSSYSAGSNYTYLWIIGTMDDKNQTYKGTFWTTYYSI